MDEESSKDVFVVEAITYILYLGGFVALIYLVWMFS